MTRLIIFPGNFLPFVGGLETHVDELSKHLSKRGYSITIFSPKIGKAKTYETIHDSVKVIRYPAFEPISNFSMPKLWTLTFWKMFFKLYKNKYDLVMTRTRFFPNSSLGMFFAKFRMKRIALMHVEHGSEFVKITSKFKTFVARMYDWTLGKLIFKLADTNVAISNAVKKFICKNFINCKKNDIPIIRRGVDFQIYKKILPDKKILNEFQDKLKIGVVCRLYKWKGIENAINAYKTLPKEVKNKCVYLIVGYGEDEKRLRELAKDEEGIHFLGKKSFKDAISAMKAFDIFLHSSYPGGGLSNSLLQAMYCKSAIIASPNEGASDVIFNNKTGILLKNNSSEQLRKAIIELVKDRNKTKILAMNAKKHIEDNFNWDKVVDQYINQIEQVID